MRTLVLMLFFVLSKHGIGQMKVSGDTIFSFLAGQDGRSGTNEAPRAEDMEYLAGEDSINQVRVFVWGEEVYLAYYDEKNKGAWPYSDNWISWVILPAGALGEGDVFEVDGEPNFSATLEWVDLGAQKPFLRINWDYHIHGMHVWSQDAGIQVWDLSEKRCYFDALVLNSVYSSDNVKGTSEEETCVLELRFEKKSLLVTKNTCGDKIKPGSYVRKGKNLLRRK